MNRAFALTIIWTTAIVSRLPPEAREKAFEAFFTTKHRGTGLGLPTARRIVEAHGGDIAIDTPAGGGTVVSISLPADR